MSTSAILKGSPAHVQLPVLLPTCVSLTRTLDVSEVSSNVEVFSFNQFPNIFPLGTSVWWTLTAPGTKQYGGGFLRITDAGLGTAGVNPTLTEGKASGVGTVNYTAVGYNPGSTRGIYVSVPATLDTDPQVCITAWRL
jgi:hypothetical protein